MTEHDYLECVVTQLIDRAVDALSDGRYALAERLVASAAVLLAEVDHEQSR